MKKGKRLAAIVLSALMAASCIGSVSASAFSKVGELPHLVKGCGFC